jgi:hypothetical protein
MLHEAMEVLVKEHLIKDNPLPLFGLTGVEHTDLNHLTAAQYHACVECVDQLKDLILDKAETYLLYQEKKVRLPGLEEDIYGTLDLGILTPDEIHIVDFKFGVGVPVDVEENPQLMAYMLGFLNFLRTSVKEKDMYMWVFQPFLNSFRGVQVTKEELEYFLCQVEFAVEEAKSGYPTYVPGEKQCRWCSAGGCCPARIKDAETKALTLMSEYFDEPVESGLNVKFLDTVDNAKLAELLATEEQVTSAYRAIREHLYGQLLMGQDVPGYKIVNGKSRRQWLDGVTPQTLETMLDIKAEALSETKMLSPAKVEKLLPRKERKILEELYVTVEGAPHMVSDKSKKPDYIMAVDKNLFD